MTLYDTYKNLIAGEKERRGGDELFTPEARNGVIIIFFDGEKERFTVAPNYAPCAPFALIHPKHALVRFPHYVPPIKNGNSQYAGVRENNLLFDLFSIRCYHPKNFAPGLLFKMGACTASSVEWVWTDGHTLRPHGPQQQRVLHRSKIKNFRRKIEELIMPAVALEALLGAKPANYRYNNNNNKSSFVEALITAAGTANIVKAARNDGMSVRSAVYNFDEALKRRFGVVEIIEVPA